MSSNVPWFKLALITTFIGVSAAIGYAASKNYGFFKDENVSEAENVESLLTQGKLSFTVIYLNILDANAPLANKNNKKKKKKVGKKSPVKKSSTNESVNATEVDPFTVAMEFIEKDASILNKLPAELKQQVFYILLIRGETLLKDTKTPESIEKAVEYFVKAVALVSHPGEVLMSYEQTLPADIFKRIVFELQNQNLEKTKAYFASLNPESGLIRFEELEGPKVTSPTGNSSAKQWTAVAGSAVTQGTVLMSEEPDVALGVLEGCCDFCFKSLDFIENDEEKHVLSDLPYCSKFCLTQAASSYGKHLENLKGTAAYAYQQLMKVVHETKVYAPILMLRYIASLLEDELAKQKATGAEDEKLFHLFSHYDYLRPAYRVPRDSDRAEAVLIRTILEPSHQDIAKFLSDEIYVAMKSTVMFNSIGFAKERDAFPVVAEEAEFSEESKISVNSDAGEKEDVALMALEPVRYSGMTAKSDFFGLYHSFAHLSHSCSPNCEIVADPQIPRRLKLVANKDLQADEKITISYNGNSASCSKEVIERDFYISCGC